MNYARAIRIIRSAHNLSQQKLARKLSLDPSYISLLEKGQRSPTIKTLEKISRKLMIPPHLITLLASDEKDLRNISKNEASYIGKKLLRYLLLVDDNEPQNSAKA